MADPIVESARGKYERLYREYLRNRGRAPLENDPAHPGFIQMMQEKASRGERLPSVLSVDPNIRRWAQREVERRGGAVAPWERAPDGSRRRKTKQGYVEVKWDSVFPKHIPWMPYPNRVAQPLPPESDRY